MWPTNEAGRSPFIKARVVGDYEKLYSICIELKKAQTRLAEVVVENDENENKVRGTFRNSSFPRCCCCAPKVDEEEWLRKSIK